MSWRAGPSIFPVSRSPRAPLPISPGSESAEVSPLGRLVCVSLERASMRRPRRIRLSRRKGWRVPPDTLKVDRSTRWGNPFRIDSKAKIADRAKVVAALRAKLTDVLRLALRAPGVFAGERGAARHANLCR